MSDIRPYTKQLLLFFDFETTGLDINELFVLETSVAVFDVEQWKIVAEKSWISRPLHDHEIEALSSSNQEELSWTRLGSNLLDPYVYKMHRDSGLLGEVLNPDVKHSTYPEINREVTELVKKHLVANDQEVYLAGSGISEFDRPIIRRFLPDLDDLLHYRSIDLGVFRRVMAFLGHSIPWGEDPFHAPAHRAVDDVRQSINQMLFFKERVGLDLKDWSATDGYLYLGDKR